jgi:leukotriene-A4 hydrolase
MNQSIETKHFKDLFKTFCIELQGKEEGQRLYDSVAWDEWLLKPGMPFVKLEFECAKLKLVYDLVEEFITCEETNIPSKFERLRELSVEQKVIFIKKLTAQSDKISLPKINFLDLKSGFSDEINPEVVEPWLVLAIKKQMTDIYPYAAEFLGKIGRMKFIKPVYAQLAKVDREFAIKVFEQHKDSYHSIAVAVLKKILGL